MVQVFVIDTGVIIYSKHLFWNRDVHFVSVPGVLEEIRDQQNRIFLEQLLEQGLLSIITPKDKNIAFIRKEARDHLGDALNLSDIDLELITLAYELNLQGKDIMLCTYDYSIQNLANYLNIKYWGEKKIENRIEWIYRCKGCGKKYSNKKVEEFNLSECSVCGSDLRRIPNKIIPIKTNNNDY